MCVCEREREIGEGGREGREEGRKEGREEGRKGGREEGRKGGREEGRKGGREKIRQQCNMKMSALYTMSTGSFPGVKRPEHGVDHPPHLSLRLKKE